MLNSMQLIERRRDRLPADVCEPLDLLAEDLQRFSQMVVDLLEISRGREGAGAREPVAAAELVTRAADRAARRPVTSVSEAARDVVLQVDKRRLERVVANLVENADRHGGGCEAVRVELGDGARTVRVVVDDAGPGISPERRTSVFDRFVRGPAAEGTGTGLGLAIVATHVEWHGGSIEVRDSPSGGARFVVELPREQRRAREQEGVR